MEEEMGHHSQILDLVDPAEATHVAVNDGAWSDPGTWEGGEVPGADARVVISNGIEVTYDMDSDASLFTVRVDGDLTFSTETDTTMVVDTIVVAPEGKLTIGTEENPIDGGVTADIVFANNGPIDTTWDPSLVSRGLVALGEVEVHGEETSAHHKVAEDPMTGDTTMTLAEAPIGWEVGDTLVIAGSEYKGYAWDNSIRATRHYEPEDEVVTITAIDGDTITFDPPLVHDHDTPREDLKISVANYSRSVTFSSEDGADSATHERGHVMLHNRESDVRYAAFDELGRTDKSETALMDSEYETTSFDTNVKSRYPLHFHSNGVDDADNPSIALGNAVFGSPGWGIVHHNSNATVHNNATYNTFGAGYVAETGNEIGIWTDNIAIYAQGNSWAQPKNGNDLDNFDLGQTGDGFWFQGRMVQATGNVAASVNTGFVYFHRGATADHPGEPGNLSLDPGSFELPEPLEGRRSITVDDAPILNFHDNETFASREGLHVVKANPNQGHDIHSLLTDFTAWNVMQGVEIQYTSHYILQNFDLVARADAPFIGSRYGVFVGNNASDIILIDISASGFNDGGIFLSHVWTDDSLGQDLKQFMVVDGTFSDTPVEVAGYDPMWDRIIDSSTLPATEFSVEFDGPLTYREGYPDPGARRVEISGTKTDSLGTVPVPAGSDSYSVNRDQVVHILETDGWFTTTSGERVFILEQYFSDRLTGEIYKIVVPVYLDDNVPLGSPHFGYADAVYRGEVDLDGAPPETRNESVVTTGGADLVIDLAGNDSDPEGGAVWVDGIVQPLNGQIFDNGDGTVTFRPHIGWSGTETVKYWVTDGLGGYTEAWLTITVTEPGVALTGSGARDHITGDAGDNMLYGYRSADWLDGGDGDDTLSGGIGNDRLSGGAGEDLLRGGTGNDRASGGDGADRIAGMDGDDSLFGGDGDDKVFGGAGSDRVFGGGGDDFLRGGSGDDAINGGGGADRIVGNTGNDALTGGNGRDIFQFALGDGHDAILDFADGIDLINLRPTGLAYSEITVTASGGDAVVTYGSDSIVIEGAAGLIDREDFLLA
ncbi:G8 domain-containing protein [Algicella marina]|uniref:G8 domain-containing protein n=1 Tax=Algicella marina TaxID=2683284 RepID=A0A6P1SY82_9RHOB|nr:G8 domain-containing protein [Algicella marina]QHQ34707.1 hypothetical protein GO499_05625 [Algicella marina]